MYVGRGREGKRTSSLLSVDGLIKLRMQRVFIGALCRQMSSCNQLERDSIFGRDSYERKLSNHHDQGPRQGATAIIEFFSVTCHTSKKFEGARGRLCSSKAQWHNGQSKPDRTYASPAPSKQYWQSAISLCYFSPSVRPMLYVSIVDIVKRFQSTGRAITLPHYI